MKKLLVTFVAVVVLASAFSFPSAAHHGNGGHRQGQSAPQQTAAQCTIDNCIEAGAHLHEGTTYSGHIAYCTMNGCTEAQVHEHDGITYGKCLNQCSVNDCTVSGNHLHDGSAYCSNHTAGTASNGNSKRGHHGRNHY